MIHIITGGAGCGKSERLMEWIQQSVKENIPIFTLVPEQFSYEFDRKLYRKLGANAFNRLQTHSFKSLARWIFQRFGSLSGDLTNADELTQYALLYQAILSVSNREHQIHMIGKQCQQISFVIELKKFYSQLRKNGIPPENFYEICNACEGRLQEKNLDYFRIYQKYDQLLRAHQLKDIETELTEAAAVANGEDAFLGDLLFLDEFESFTEDEYEMLAVLFSSCKDIYLALRTEDVEQSEPDRFSLFASVNETLARIRRMAEERHIPVTLEHCTTPYRFQNQELLWLSTHVFRKQEPYPALANHLHILEAEDPAEEADFTCAAIRRLLEQNPSLRCRDIAVLTNQQSAYHSVLETAMLRYELPYHFDEKEAILYTPLILYLLTLLELLRQPKPDTDLLLRLGKTNLTDCTLYEISVLENYCYTWSVDGKTWLSPFTGGNCEAAEQLRKKLLQPFHSLKKSFSQAKTGEEFCKLLFVFLKQNQIEEKLNQQLHRIPEPEAQLEFKKRWAFAWNNWISVLDHMAKLYQDFLLEPSEFCSIAAAMLHTIRYAVPPRTLDAIFISDGNTARLNAPKIVFLLGVCEGTFPTVPGGSGLFSEKECITLENLKLPVLRPRDIQMADARLAAYKLLSSASESLYLLYSNVDIAQQRHYPASVLTQITRMFPQDSHLKRTCRSYGSAFFAGTLHAAYFQYIRHYADNTSDTRSIGKLLYEDSSYRKRLDSLKALAEQHLPHADRPLFAIPNSALMQSVLGNRLLLSATSLEQYRLCPFSYFCNHILHLHSRQRMQLAGANAGSLIHYCLEQLLRQYDRDAFLSLSMQEMLQEVATYSSAYWQEHMGGDFSKSDRELATLQHTLQNMEPLLRHLQEELQQTSFFPKYLELEISSENPDFPPLNLQTEHGHMVQLMGKIDRVDLCQSGADPWVRVIDYKTGSREFSLGNLLYGLDLQMLIYLFTIIAPGSALANASPAGVLYMPAGKIQNELARGADVSPQKHYYDTYQMNGVLCKDPSVLRAMEPDGKGIFLTGALTTDGRIDEKSGQFLTIAQMTQLRRYVLQKLADTADEIYAGEIDANPLQITGRDSCLYCAFSNICGNADHRRHRCMEGNAKARKEKLLQALEEAKSDFPEKGETSNGMD